MRGAACSQRMMSDVERERGDKARCCDAARMLHASLFDARSDSGAARSGVCYAAR